VRSPEDEAREEFHKGEYVLYITRANNRLSDQERQKREELEREHRDLTERVALLEGLNRVGRMVNKKK
jgi:hypothetical protein